MLTSLIPPIPDLNLFGHGNFHLILAQLCEVSEEYTNHYRTQVEAGRYVILDNGAHELSEGMQFEELMSLAHEIGCQEVVVPDVLFDYTATLARCVEFMDKLCAAYTHNQFPRLMVVPQGVTEGDWEKCRYELCELMGFYKCKEFTLGISKDYTWMPVNAIIGTYVSPFKRRNPKCSIHLLGWARDLWGLSKVARLYPNVIRSTDSAKPFVYALNGIELNPCNIPDVPEYPTRSPGYFFDGMNAAQREIAARNVAVFRGCGAGRYYSP